MLPFQPEKPDLGKILAEKEAQMRAREEQIRLIEQDCLTAWRERGFPSIDSLYYIVKTEKSSQKKK
jgi:hypothetical protein